jgi:hypothetical protein
MTAIDETPDVTAAATYWDHQAECVDCGKAWASGNALAVAKIHARAHRHVVNVSMRVQVTYWPWEEALIVQCQRWATP